MSLNIYRSNRVEALLAALADVVRQPAASPFAAETIVVQSRGMAAWLGMRLAEEFGVWANPDFPHPRQLVQRVLRASLGREGDLVQRFSRERLAFVLCDLLEQCPDDADFFPLRAYLAGSSGVGRLELARRLAHLFDQYAVYRPDMVLAWEQGDDTAGGRDPGPDRWQPRLWRQVVARLGCCSPARLMVGARQVLAAGTLPFPGMLPQRLCLFGIDTLPRVYLSLLDALSGLLPVHFFLLSPSEAYFAHIASRAEQERALARLALDPAEAEFCFETGHPLLAASGALARDFQKILEEDTRYHDAGEYFFAHQQPVSILEILQNDILRLAQRGGTDREFPCLPLRRQDDSLVVHSCHSRLREVEVLRDQLCALFQDDPSLQPRDVVVMLPDVELYAPLIEAVFSRPPGAAGFLPFRIADRAASAAFPLLEVFFRILDLARSRLTGPEVMELLACPAIREKFGISAEELPRFRLWLQDAGVCWGVDEEHRLRLGQPGDRQNTWRFGFDRLTLGYALRPEGEVPGPVLPCEILEGQGAEAAGRFFLCCETLFACLDELGASRDVPGWQAVLAALLDSLFAADPSRDWQVQRFRDWLEEIAREAREAEFAGRLDLAEITVLLRDKAGQAGSAHGFAEGAVTFCGMLPMRSVPFRVVCVLGMNDGEFPRQETVSGFDLMARFPRAGDRSRRQDDRYLFLEALLAAREKFLIFFVGGSMRDNTSLPPSVLVEELFDCAAEGFSPEDFPEGAEDPGRRRKEIVRRLLVRHPLQPFHPEYFSGRDPRLFSFAEEHCQGALARRQGRTASPLFLSRPLPGGEHAPGRLSLEELKRCLAGPARWFLENRLALFLGEREIVLPEREPVSPDNLQQHELARELLAVRLAEKISGKELLRRWQGQGRLPLGTAARAVFAEIDERVEPVLAALFPFVRGERLPPLAAEVSLGPGLVLAGTLGERRAQGLVRGGVGRLHGSMLLPAWLDHLFLCALAPEDQEQATFIVGRDRKDRAEVLRLRPVAGAVDLLAALAGLQAAGLEAPLLFFPKSSLVFARTWLAKAGLPQEERQRAALAQARQEYEGSWQVPGEGDTPWARQLFANADPIADPALLPGRTPFADLALTVFAPMLAHLEELS